VSERLGDPIFTWRRERGEALSPVQPLPSPTTRPSAPIRRLRGSPLPARSGRVFCISSSRCTKPATSVRKVVSGRKLCPQRLKPYSRRCSYRSGEPLRHPKSTATPTSSAACYRHNHLANLPSSRTKQPKIRVRRRIFSQTA
jgi:hypothetical protein